MTKLAPIAVLLMTAAGLADISTTPPPSGNKVAGLRATVKLGKSTFASGEAIPIHLDIQNLDEVSQDLTLITRWDCSTLCFWRSNSAAQAQIQLRKLTGPKSTRGRGVYGAGSPLSMRAGRLPPGESAPFEYTLDLEDPLSPGLYELCVCYYAQKKGLLQRAKADLLSNSVRILIR